MSKDFRAAVHKNYILNMTSVVENLTGIESKTTAMRKLPQILYIKSKDFSDLPAIYTGQGAKIDVQLFICKIIQ